jgi:hypothetical protein
MTLKLKRILKASVMTLSGLIALMFITAILIMSVGTLATGGMENWKVALKNAAPYLFFLRLCIYSVGAVIWSKTYRLHQEKNNKEGLERTKRIGIVSVIIIAMIEVPKLFGG